MLNSLCCRLSNALPAQVAARASYEGTTSKTHPSRLQARLTQAKIARGALWRRMKETLIRLKANSLK
ncbi:MAG: hypothetical protein C4K48_05495 [Candidatus Thorarchaeota archaeon]|nr:MAG: hypothetical protein C4K48_05495 [Candidatus Thorarchaeota archaeon]